MHNRLIFYCLFSFLSAPLFAQTEWKPQGLLYRGNGIVVELEFFQSNNVCSATPVPSRIRYKITGNPTSDFYINWKMDYYNCKNVLVSQNNNLKIDKTIRPVMESPDWIFPGNRIANSSYSMRITSGIELLPNTPNEYEISVEPIAIDGDLQIESGESITLSVSGGTLGKGAIWKWFANECGGAVVGTGNSISITPTQNTTYFVRAEGLNTTQCLSANVTVSNKAIIASQAIQTPQTVVLRKEKAVKVRPEKPIKLPKPKTFSKPSFFLNAGISTNNVEEISNLPSFSATAGSGRNFGWYGRVKFSIAQTSGNYETDNSSLTNFNNSGYYRYNGKISNTRTGYTGGLFYGNKIVSIYLGGGYGTRDLFWGIDEGSYENLNDTKQSWAKNTTSSVKGSELEGGLLLRFGVINIVAGISSIKDYKDVHVGIGFNIK